MSTLRSIDSSAGNPLHILKEDVFEFPEGMVGFAEYKKYLLVRHESHDEAFFWLQSQDVASLAFPVVDPIVFCPEYNVQIPAQDLASIQLMDESQGRVLVVATVPPDLKNELWLNLQAPLVLNKDKKRGKQVTLDPSVYPLRYKVRF